MDKKITEKIEALVADNQLEEALDLIIGIEQNRGQERYNTLLLLKGKLAMLEEQELAGMLDFDELAQQKMKIAHALLKMSDDETSPNPTNKPSPSKHVEIRKTVNPPSLPPSPIFKYAMMALLGIALIIAASYIFKSSSDKPSEEPSQELPITTNDKAENLPATDKPTIKKEEEKSRPVTPPVADNSSQETSPKPPTPKKETVKDPPPPQPVQEQTKPVQDKAQESSSEVRLVRFPKLNHSFNFSDIKYTFNNAQLEKSSSGKLKLTLKMSLTCRNNLGTCDREEVHILANGKAVAATSRTTSKKWMDSGTSTKEQLIFIFDAGADPYYIKLEKNHSDWTRGFKVLE